jgi:hypothetical protein
MADFGKLRRNLPPPPPMDEASENLKAPEVAPIAPEPVQTIAAPVAPASLPAAELPPPRRDGRTMRRTNRTVAFATRVSPEFDNRVRDIAERDGLMLVEVLERALEAYEKDRTR